jgi:hypothetical protein
MKTTFEGVPLFRELGESTKNPRRRFATRNAEKSFWEMGCGAGGEKAVKDAITTAGCRNRSLRLTGVNGG